MKKILTLMAIAAIILPACKGNSGSSAEAGDSTAAAAKRNKQTAMDVEKAYVDKDLDGAFKNCAVGYADYGPSETKAETNMDTLKANMKQFYAAFPDYKAENLLAVADSNVVVVTGVWSGTFKNDFMKIKATGKSFRAPDADIFTFDKDGKITSHRSIQEQSTFFVQLGILMPPTNH